MMIFHWFPDLDECRNDTCKNDGNCIDNGEKVFCNCTEGWISPICDIGNIKGYDHVTRVKISWCYLKCGQRSVIRDRILAAKLHCKNWGFEQHMIHNKVEKLMSINSMKSILVVRLVW